MKQVIMSTIALAVMSFHVKAQCNNDVRLTSSRTDFLNAANEIKEGKDENVVVDITKSTFTITPNGNELDVMKGTIKDITCEWKVPYKEGKMIIKTDLEDPGGDIKDATITIEGKDGKITLLAEAKEMPDRKLKLHVDKFEETKK